MGWFGIDRFRVLTQGFPITDIVAGYDLSNQLDAIENLMNQEVPAMQVLRAAVLLHLAQGGIRQKMLENFKREFLQVSFHCKMKLARTHMSWPDLWILSFAAPYSAGDPQPLVKVAVQHNLSATSQGPQTIGGRGG